MALDIQLADEGSGRRRVRLTGRLDTVTAPELDARLATVLADPAATAVVFDLAALEYISSAGIRSVVKALPSSQVFGSSTELDAYLDMMQRRVRRG